MKKIAVFVEGQSEQILARELLLRKFNWHIDLKCLKLYKKGQFAEAPYSTALPDADFHYTIYDVGGDVEVLNEILLYESHLWEQGFDRIVGLRDMYSDRYNTISAGKIDPAVNNNFITGHKETISAKTKHPAKIHFCFSIMEVEAWLLGIHAWLNKVHEKLSIEYIYRELGLNLAAIDPEATFFNPAKNLKEILNLVEIGYDKHRGDIERICQNITTEDYDKLSNGANCSSFNTFYNSILLRN